MSPLLTMLFEGLAARLRLRGPGRRIANKMFPAHWSYLLGEVALISFGILVLTGIFLTLFYQPSLEPVTYEGGAHLIDGNEVPAAFASIARLSEDIPGGLLFRRLHRAAAHVFVVAVVLHLARVLLTGAFRRPREVNWHVGIALLALALLAGFTGYSLPWDALAGTGVRIGYTLTASIPVAGEALALGLFGGDFPSSDLLPRIYVAHVLLIPGAIVGGIAVHLMLVTRQRHTQMPRRGVDGHRWVHGKPMWPTQFAESTTLALLLFALLAGSSLVVPWADVVAQGPYRPGEIGNQAQPEWFMFWLEGPLRLLPAVEWTIGPVAITGPLIAGLVLPGLVFVALIAYPFWERRVYRLDGDWHVATDPTRLPLRLAFSFGLGMFLLVVSTGAANDAVSRSMGVPVETVTQVLRGATIAVPAATVWACWALARRRVRRVGPSPQREATDDEEPTSSGTAEP